MAAQDYTPGDSGCASQGGRWITCQQCGQVFRPKRASEPAKYCSRDCYLASRRPASKRCPSCAKIFSPSQSRERYCSPQCGHRAAGRAVIARFADYPKTCTVAGCNRDASSGGVCTTHSRRMRRSGTYDTPHGRRPDGMSVYDWFMSRVDKGDGTGCWEWTGQIAHQRNGYGMFYDSDRGRKIHAHLYLVPPIPTLEESGGVRMEYDHLCRNTRCVRPDHLELVTAKENQRRARAAIERQCIDCGASLTGLGLRALRCKTCR